MQFRVTQFFIFEHKATPVGSILTVPDYLGRQWITDGLGVALPSAPARETAVRAPRSKAITQKPIDDL